MKTLSLLILVAGLTLAACDNNTEPMKANTDAVNKNPQVDQDARPQSTTGGDQPVAVPASK
jgi:hypothetical protein